MTISKADVVPIRPEIFLPACNTPQFSSPHQVVSDDSLALDEKKAILASWASDACAVRSQPTLRYLPGMLFPVTLSAIIEARTTLDMIEGRDGDDDPPPPPHSMRQCCPRRVFREAA